MDHGWRSDGDPSEASVRDMEREVFECVFGCAVAPRVRIPCLTLYPGSTLGASIPS